VQRGEAPHRCRASHRFGLAGTARIGAGASEFVSYPGEGHGVSGFPAVIDYTARLVDWFERFMPA
jgi:dipeptidyl aminopeptidase/acylaminoacyl peptidase